MDKQKRELLQLRGFPWGELSSKKRERQYTRRALESACVLSEIERWKESLQAVNLELEAINLKAWRVRTLQKQSF